MNWKVKYLEHLDHSPLFSLYKLSDKADLIFSEESMKLKGRWDSIDIEKVIAVEHHFPRGLNMESWVKLTYSANQQVKEMFLISREWTGIFGALNFKSKNERLIQEIKKRYVYRNGERK